MDEQALIDTNIFLEVLLDQQRSLLCRAFLQNQTPPLLITDFSIHSIGVTLFRLQRFDLFRKFVADLVPRIQVLTLPAERSLEILSLHEEHHLDFDDSYQLAVAESFHLRLVTIDRDFRKVKSLSNITILE